MDCSVSIRLSPSAAPQAICPNCGFATWCRSAGLTSLESKLFYDRIAHRRPLRRSEHLHHAGSVFNALHVINSGLLKTRIMDGDGREQITGFHMTGELIGSEGIGTGKHQCDSIALENSYLCGITYSDLEQLMRDIPALQHHFHRMMGVEILRDYGIMLMLGAMRAEERVAAFLLDLSDRFISRGYSGTHFKLSMTRQEIGDYLGLKLETVSRVFSRFHELDLIAVDKRQIEIRKLSRMQGIVIGHQARAALNLRATSAI